MFDELVNDLMSVANTLDEIDKKASLINIGDVILCLNPIEGICKGQTYRVTAIKQPNYIEIEDLYGNTVGVYRTDRFCINNREASFRNIQKQSAVRSSEFDVPNYELVNVNEESDGYEVIYKGKRPSNSSIFDKAKITRKNYEPVDVSVNKDEVTVFFEKQGNIQKKAYKYKESGKGILETISNHPDYDKAVLTIGKLIQKMVRETKSNYMDELDNMGFKNIKDYEKTLKNDVISDLEKAILTFI